jgi:hypothetical protein
VSIDVALKEWQVVIDLLSQGRQSILLRKGGIQEGPGGFSIQHDRFAFMPTRLHQKPEMLLPEFRDMADGGDVEPETFGLTHGGRVDETLVVPSREALDRLDGLHGWDEPYLEMRWNYRPERPLYLVIVRAYELSEPRRLRNTYEVAGCRSWVPLEPAAAFGQAVMDDEAADEVRQRVRTALTA